MKIDPLNIGLIIVTVISALSAWAAQRASSRATIVNARSVAETEAYSRARKMDVETIERQDREYEELEQKYKLLKQRMESIKEADNDR